MICKPVKSGSIRSFLPMGSIEIVKIRGIKQQKWGSCPVRTSLVSILPAHHQDLSQLPFFYRRQTPECARRYAVALSLDELGRWQHRRKRKSSGNRVPEHLAPRME